MPTFFDDIDRVHSHGANVVLPQHVPRYVSQGVFRREFTGGIVLLNEPRRPSVTVELDQPMRLLNGAVVTSVTLATRQAKVPRDD